MGALSEKEKKECLADPREFWLVINSILFSSSVKKMPAKQQFQKIKTIESAKVVTVPLTKWH